MSRHSTLPSGGARRAVFAAASALALAAAWTPALAAGDDEVVPPAETADYGTRVEELTVVGAAPVLTTAPVKASLEATQPQSIITREAIDQFIPQTGDFTQVVLLAPSISGSAFNGPGFSES